MRKLTEVFLTEASPKKLEGIVSSFAGMVDQDLHAKMQQLMGELDKEFVVVPPDLRNALENFMSEWAMEHHNMTRRRGR